MKLKDKTTPKERDQQLLKFIIIDLLNIEQQHLSSKFVITLPMNIIINSSFNKDPMSWELIHYRLLHSSEYFMKAMCHYQTQNDLPKQYTNKLDKAPCTICYTAKITNSPKGATVDRSNLKPGELIHIDFAFYNVTSICGFTSILTVFREKTRMIWVFSNAS